MEWHYMCGYDKLHIFTGSIENYGSTNRIARFCGPKMKGWSKPFDGTRQLKNIGGVLPMWDEPYDTNTNEVIIGIDLDQGQNYLFSLLVKFSDFYEFRHGFNLPI